LLLQQRRRRREGAWRMANDLAVGRFAGHFIALRGGKLSTA
jgi:hypothetical protein